ncbi:ABC transporter ATP-binding protein [Chloroflexi bacterium TSY]|nr:ABC transporter ATP-binding protein [Chloroflexi bacterium TSY]
MPKPVIQIQQLVKTYTNQAKPVTALKGIDIQVFPGEFLVITGKSGAGKTTLVNMITGLDRVTSGEIWINGTPVHQLSPERAARWRGQNVGVVFQMFELMPNMSVLRNVTLPMDFVQKFSIRQRRKRALALLDQVEIAEHAHKLPSEVSGGQQQRIAIARALANDPPILVADEPTGSLDSVTSATVLDVFQALSKQGKTVLLVTHDKDVEKWATRTITLADGELVSEVAEVNDDRIQEELSLEAVL